LRPPKGRGLAWAGLITIIPDLGILSGITLRTLQKLSLLYGFEFNTEEETAELWIAAATAAGVDISRELVEKKWSAGLCARHPAHCRAGEQGSGGKVVGPDHPLASSVIWRGLELLFRARLGRTRPLPLPQTPHGDSQPAG